MSRNYGVKHICPRAFIYAAPHEWNKLPLFIRKSIDLSTFKSSPKTYLVKLVIYIILFYLDIYIILLLNIYA